ncbi:MAG: TraR/DksA family transcriptional regulator [Verrucomicrobia bacterium]|nr:TraR/DksA family transcriptional regulator [Verrucomicrobiota bacterium]
MTLTEKEIESYKEKLLTLQKQHGQAFRESVSDVKTPDEAKGASQHHADEGTDDFDKTISIQLTTQELDVLKQIARALEKMQEGTYGLCDLTGEPIPKKRLEAIPYATMTIEAQTKLEKGLL